jgi:hypothetical protein
MRFKYLALLALFLVLVLVACAPRLPRGSAQKALDQWGSRVVELKSGLSRAEVERILATTNHWPVDYFVFQNDCYFLDTTTCVTLAFKPKLAGRQTPEDELWSGPEEIGVMDRAKKWHGVMLHK